MSQSRQGKLDHAGSSGQQLALRAELAAPVARPRALALLAGFLLLVLVLVLFFQINAFLSGLEARLAIGSGGEARLSAMSQQMDSLKGKLNGLLADSVEIRLKTLEKNVSAGKVSADDLDAFHSLQRDLNLLEDYALAAGSAVLDYDRNEHPRFQPLAGSASAVLPSNHELVNEIARLKGLFYLCLTGLATGTGLLTIRYFRGKGRSLPAAASSGKPRLTHQGNRRQRRHG